MFLGRNMTEALNALPDKKMHECSVFLTKRSYYDCIENADNQSA